MAIDYVIKEEQRGKKIEIKIPLLKRGAGLKWVDGKISLNIPKNAHYICVDGIDPPLEWFKEHYPDKDPEEMLHCYECEGDQLALLPFLIYLDAAKKSIGTQELLSVNMFSLDEILESIFEKYHL